MSDKIDWKALAFERGVLAFERGVMLREMSHRIEALEAALRRIDAINGSPASFNKDIDDVCRAVFASEPEA